MIKLTFRVNLREIFVQKETYISLAVIVVSLIILNKVYHIENLKIESMKSSITQETQKNEIFTQIGVLDEKMKTYDAYRKISKTERTLLLNEVSSLATKCGLTIGSINFDKEDVRNYYTLFPIRVSLTGNYHDFGIFVSNIESSEHFFKVANLKVSKFEDAGTDKTVEKFDLMINAVIVKE